MLWAKGKDFCHLLLCNKNFTLRKQPTIPYLQPLFYIPQLFLPFIHIQCKYAQNRDKYAHIQSSRWELLSAVLVLHYGIRTNLKLIYCPGTFGK